MDSVAVSCFVIVLMCSFVALNNLCALLTSILDRRPVLSALNAVGVMSAFYLVFTFAFAPAVAS